MPEKNQLFSLLCLLMAVVLMLHMGIPAFASAAEELPEEPQKEAGITEQQPSDGENPENGASGDAVPAGEEETDSEDETDGETPDGEDETDGETSGGEDETDDATPDSDDGTEGKEAPDGEAGSDDEATSDEDKTGDEDETEDEDETGLIAPLSEEQEPTGAYTVHIPSTITVDGKSLTGYYTVEAVGFDLAEGTYVTVEADADGTLSSGTETVSFTNSLDGSQLWHTDDCLTGTIRVDTPKTSGSYRGTVSFRIRYISGS